MRILRWAAVAALTGTALAGCAQTAGGSADTAAPVPSGSTPAEAAFIARAQQIAEIWRAADKSAFDSGFAPGSSDLSVMPPAGFPDGATKLAAVNHWYALDTDLPGTPSNGVVRFEDGSTVDLPLLSARQAYAAIATGGSPTCTHNDDCTRLTITGAVLSTATWHTLRGVATVPVWNFTVRGLPDPIGWLAVAPSAFTPLPQLSPPPAPTAPLLSAQGVTAVNGNRIDFGLQSTCAPGAQPLFWESGDVVVLGGTYPPPPPDLVCAAVLSPPTPVSVTLTRPLGDRKVLDVMTGWLQMR